MYNMVSITFKAKIRKANNVYVVTIPAQYMKDGVLWDGEQFSITVNTNEE